ncbi:MAG: hypothetical protein KKD05_11100 [Candidatus Omnitrophica bacterium]|nr:hypothetical protein [Candidatus Omnitrophota bacterium]
MRKRLWIIISISISIYIVLVGPNILNIYADSNNDRAKSGANKFKIAIFKEEGFPAVCVPGLLTPQWLYENISKEFLVSYLDTQELSDKNYLNTEKVDLLILPYGEAFPQEAFKSIKNYIYQGGGIFNIAGRPFWVPVKRIKEKWQKVQSEDPYNEFLAPLGIKYYELPDENMIGLTVANSLKNTPIVPSYGNVFPYRIPVRDFFHSELLKKYDYAKSIIFIESWLNPYTGSRKDMPKKWVLIGANNDNNPLNPANNHARENLLNIIRQVSFPIVLSELSTDMPVYKQGEVVKIFAKVLNTGREVCKFNIELRIIGKNGKIIFKKNKKIKLKAGGEISLDLVWAPEEFKSDFYKLQAEVKAGGVVFGKKENGFLVFNHLGKNNPVLSIRDGRFYINDKQSMLFGVNYYESKSGELLWVEPNVLKIRNDFKSMRDLGINFVRIHYHHSKWFRDYFSDILKMEIDPYLQAADKTYLPSERSLRILDALIYLAGEHNMVFCIDLFTLVPKEMGNPIGWLGLKERIIDQDKVKRQLEFIKILAERYEGTPGIVWDLWNEPRLADDDLGILREWALLCKNQFRNNGDNHFITIGGPISLKLIDILDYASVHTYNIKEFTTDGQLRKPFIFGEVWNDAGSSLGEEIKQAKKMENDLREFIKSEASGFVPWQWTRQDRLWDDASEPEKWDDELGCCVHGDGSLKPAGMIYSSWIKRMKNRDSEKKR